MTTRQGSPFTSYRVMGLGGGLNKGISSFKLNDDELREAKNTRFALAGSVTAREGARRYDLSTSAHLTGSSAAGAKAFRYNRSDGSAKVILALGDGNCYIDANDGVFTSAGTVPYSSDGHVRFTQWRDTVFATGTSGVPKVFNTDTASDIFYDMPCTGVSDTASASVFTSAMKGTGTEGQWVDGNSHSYRFTLDYYLGNDFLGEGFPIHATSGTAARNGILPLNDYYWSVSVDVSGNATDHFEIKKGAGSFSFATKFPLAKTINVYRSPGAMTGTTVDLAQKNTRTMDIDFYYVGSIECSNYDAASSTNVLFTDYGVPSSGWRLSTHEQFDRLVKPKFCCAHKGRIWYANVSEWLVTFGKLEGGQFYSVTETAIVERSKVYASNLGEPCAVRFKGWTAIGQNDGESITGMASWKDRALFVFKQNSITGVYGGDSESIEGVPDIEIEIVDENVGCIAPETLCFGEGGILFLSNRGPMFFDGTTPMPIRSKHIEYYLDRIPADRRSRATAGYDNKNRRYMLAISQE